MLAKGRQPKLNAKREVHRHPHPNMVKTSVSAEKMAVHYMTAALEKSRSSILGFGFPLPKSCLMKVWVGGGFLCMPGMGVTEDEKRLHRKDCGVGCCLTYLSGLLF